MQEKGQNGWMTMIVTRETKSDLREIMRVTRGVYTREVLTRELGTMGLDDDNGVQQIDGEGDMRERNVGNSGESSEHVSR